MKARRSRVKSAVERDRVAREELLELSWVGRDLYAAPPVQLFPDVLERIVIVLGGENGGVRHPRKNTRDTRCGALSGTADTVGQRIKANKHRERSEKPLRADRTPCARKGGNAREIGRASCRERG